MNYRFTMYTVTSFSLSEHKNSSTRTPTQLFYITQFTRHYALTFRISHYEFYLMHYGIPNSRSTQAACSYVRPSPVSVRKSTVTTDNGTLGTS